MGIIEEPQNLKGYLEFEGKVAQDSKTKWGQELELFCGLADLYDRLRVMVDADETKMHRMVIGLFLVVKDQMEGVVSQLLRRRLTDAMGLTRRAIEATATAYRLWVNPDLGKVFDDGFPNIEKTGDPKQWKPSNDFNREFSTSKLFSPKGNTWRKLERVYQMYSALSTHAGLGTVITLTFKEYGVSIPSVEPDEKQVQRQWIGLMAVYLDILKVFLRIFHSVVNAQMVSFLEMEILSWREKVASQMAQQASFMAEGVNCELSRFFEEG